MGGPVSARERLLVDEIRALRSELAEYHDQLIGAESELRDVAVETAADMVYSRRLPPGCEHSKFECVHCGRIGSIEDVLLQEDHGWAHLMCALNATDYEDASDNRTAIRAIDTLAQAARLVIDGDLTRHTHRELEAALKPFETQAADE